MKRFNTLNLVLMLCLFVAVSPRSGFAEASPAVAAVAGAVAQPAPTPIPVGTPMPAVAVAEPAAPPAWAQQLIVTVEKLPVVGPIVAKLLLWTGIVASCLTALVACILTILNTLMGVLNLAGVVNVAAALAKFRDGKIMYYLKFFSMFNAKKDPQV